jgi:hypothetical protein
MQAGAPEGTPRRHRTRSVVAWLETIQPQASEFWQVKSVLAGATGERSVWEVEFQLQAMPPASSRRPPPDQVAADLLEALLAARDFAATQSRQVFVEAFERSIVALSSENPGQAAWQVAAESLELPLAARQLLAACKDGWVFGGMGAWDDAVYSGADALKFELTTNRLLDCLIAAAMSGTNASFRPQAGKPK